THRVYVPMLDDATIEQLLSLHEFNYNQLVNRVMQSDADPSVIAYVVDEILPYLNTNDVDAARTTAMQIGRGGSRPTLPVGIRASYSPDLARDASTLLASVVDEMVTGGPRVVRRQGTYGIVERVPGFDYGHHRLAASGRYADTEVLHLTRVDTAGRITPIDPSTEVVRYSRHADANGLYVLDDHGDI